MLRFRHCRWLLVLALVLGAALSLVGPGGAGQGVASAASSNPVVTENQQPGTTAWQITKAGTDSVGQVKGYASATSVNKGGSITFYVSVNPAQTFTIDVYRIGWYQGLGGRLMQHISGLQGTQQPTCPTDPTTGMTACNWAASYTLATQTSWTSGNYLALLTNAQGYQNYVVFVVRDDSRVAALLYQQPVTTYEAYNDYPDNGTTGKSLYEFDSNGANTVAGTPRAVKVSFDRPYADDGTGAAGQSFLTWDTNFVRWMEKSGYDVTYSTDVDTHENGRSLLNHKGLLSPSGHDEYWSKAMYDAWQAARDAGVNLGFFGADSIGWQIRFESSAGGVPDRVIVCYKDATIDPETDPSLETVMWWNYPQPFRPQQALIGVQLADQVANNVPYVVTNSSNWVYAGTGFKDGDSVPGIVGYEADRMESNYPSPNAVAATYTLLSHSPFTDYGTTTSDYANSSVYQAPSGAWVFAAGTIDWSWALDNYGGRNVVDARIQQTTANILNRFVGSQQADFSLGATPSSQSVGAGGSTTYSVTVAPTNGFSGQVSLSASGLPTGASASFSPNPTGSTSTMTVRTTAGTKRRTPVGSYPFTITGTSGSLTHTATATLVVSGASDFSLGATPSSQSVGAGGSTTYSVGVTPTNGFSGQVSLSANGLPTGASASFSPNPTGSTSTMTVTTTTGTAAGSYPLTITGTSGSLTHATGVTLVVQTISPSSNSYVTHNDAVAATTISIKPAAVGNLLVVLVANGANSYASSVSGGPVASWTPVPGTKYSTSSGVTRELWYATANSTSASTVTVNGVNASNTTLHEIEYTNGNASTVWTEGPDGASEQTSGTTFTWPSLTPSAPNAIWVGYAWCSGNQTGGSYSGWDYQADNGGNEWGYGLHVTQGTAYAPTGTQTGTDTTLQGAVFSPAT